MAEQRPVLWCDFETGGLDPQIHSPLSFAMIATKGREIIGEWYTQIREEPLVITTQAIRLNKIDILEYGLSYYEFRMKYHALMNAWFFGGTGPDGRSKIKPTRDTMPYFAGQNTFFDRPFLHKIIGDYDACSYHRKDLMILANACADAGLIDLPNMKLQTISAVLGIEPEGDLHNALVDIKLTFKCWNALIDMIKPGA